MPIVWFKWSEHFTEPSYNKGIYGSWQTNFNFNKQGNYKLFRVDILTQPKEGVSLTVKFTDD